MSAPRADDPRTAQYRQHNRRHRADRHDAGSCASRVPQHWRRTARTARSCRACRSSARSYPIDWAESIFLELGGNDGIRTGGGERRRLPAATGNDYIQRGRPIPCRASSITTPGVRGQRPRHLPADARAIRAREGGPFAPRLGGLIPAGGEYCPLLRFNFNGGTESTRVPRPGRHRRRRAFPDAPAPRAGGLDQPRGPARTPSADQRGEWVTGRDRHRVPRTSASPGEATVHGHDYGHGDDDDHGQGRRRPRVRGDDGRSWPRQGRQGQRRRRTTTARATMTTMAGRRRTIHGHYNAGGSRLPTTDRPADPTPTTGLFEGYLVGKGPEEHHRHVEASACHLPEPIDVYVYLDAPDNGRPMTPRQPAGFVSHRP